jgi:hypothetical protein
MYDGLTYVGPDLYLHFYIPLYTMYIVSLNSIMFSYAIRHMCAYPFHTHMCFIPIYLIHTSRLN